MAVPVHIWFYDDGGSLIKGSCDVQDREGSVEIRGLTHNLSIPTDPLSGRLTGTRKHALFLFEKEIDSSSPLLLTILATVLVPATLNLFNCATKKRPGPIATGIFSLLMHGMNVRRHDV